jgi:outer membrane immunogenic protein
MHRMALAFGAFSAFVGGLQTASAADMPVKAPPPIALYDWSGVYVGAHVGFGFGSTTVNSLPQPPVPFPGAGLASSHSPDLSGGLGGFQFGINWQRQRWVYGLEADFSFSGLKADKTVSPSPSVLPGIAGSSLSLSRNVKGLGTLRARFGHAFDRSLFYVTGGLAWARVDYSGIDNFPGAIVYSGSASQTALGWTIGGGWEVALPAQWSRWTFKAEYLYYSLPGTDVLAPPAPPNPPFTAIYDFGRTKGSIIRVGLNYRFGGPFPAMR